jgi:glycosyltransferase involved in cell wall biosynthesis
MTNGPVVSCLCVTRDRVDLLRRAVSCFQAQTYAQRELVLLYESDDFATRDYALSIADPMVVPVEIPAVPKQPLGTLRNLAIESGSGDYVAQWDDDDWHSPARLEAQMSAIREHRRPGCVLYRWVLYDAVARRAYISGQRPWEGSLVARRDAMPPYPALKRLEDTPVVDAMFMQNMLVCLDSPELYVYTYHGANTWDAQHWNEQVLPYGEPLPSAMLAQIEQVLGVSG